MLALRAQQKPPSHAAAQGRIGMGAGIQP